MCEGAGITNGAWVAVHEKGIKWVRLRCRKTPPLHTGRRGIKVRRDEVVLFSGEGVTVLLDRSGACVVGATLAVAKAYQAVRAARERRGTQGWYRMYRSEFTLRPRLESNLKACILDGERERY